jgi:hypothetical protein
MTDHDINTATPQAARNALSRRYVPRGKTQTLPGLALGLAVLALGGSVARSEQAEPPICITRVLTTPRVRDCGRRIAAGEPRSWCPHVHPRSCAGRAPSSRSETSGLSARQRTHERPRSRTKAALCLKHPDGLNPATIRCPRYSCSDSETPASAAEGEKPKRACCNP